MGNRMLITTTPNLEGCVIRKYIGVVSHQLVQGAGFMSEVFAGFSDVFGSKSILFQEKLEGVRNDAIKKLSEKAKAMGANGIVGLTVYFDQISGKNTQLFMISVTGTAIVFDRNESIKDEEMEAENIEQSVSISGLELLRQISIENILKKINNRTLVADDEFWTSLPEYVSPEITNWIFDYSCNRWEKDGYVPNMMGFNLEQALEYIDHIEREELLGIVYSELQKDRCDWTLIVSIIERRKLVDFGKIYDCFLGDDPKIARRLIPLLDITKNEYYIEDIKNLEKIINYIKENLIIERNVIEVKGLMSKRIVWVCLKCSTQNDLDFVYCHSCQADHQGFAKGEVTYSVLVEHLENKCQIMKTIFL